MDIFLIYKSKDNVLERINITGV